MDESIKKQREARKHSVELFREADHAQKRLIEATNKVTEAEKYLGEVEKEQAQVDQALQRTEKSLKETQDDLVKSRESQHQMNRPGPVKTDRHPRNKTPPE